MLITNDINRKAMIWVAVVLAHILALYWATRQVVVPMPIPKETTMQAVIIMPVSLAPKVEQPKPKPPEITRPKPVVLSKPQPVLAKQAALPPSEKAITIEKPAVQEKAADVTEEKTPAPPVNEAPVVKAEPTPEPEIVPPRSDASSLNNPKPTYPSMSKRLAEQGKVLLDVLILANGKVGEIRLKQSSGYKRLDDAAMQTVKQWQFQPAKRGNQAIDYWYVQPVSFSLDN